MNYFLKTSKRLSMMGIICLINAALVTALAIYRQKFPLITIIAIVFALAAAAYDFKSAAKCRKYAKDEKWFDTLKDT